jgi:hypothetical protein
MLYIEGKKAVWPKESPETVRGRRNTLIKPLVVRGVHREGRIVEDKSSNALTRRSMQRWCAPLVEPTHLL